MIPWDVSAFVPAVIPDPSVIDDITNMAGRHLYKLAPNHLISPTGTLSLVLCRRPQSHIPEMGINFSFYSLATHEIFTSEPRVARSGDMREIAAYRLPLQPPMELLLVHHQGPAKESNH